MWIERSKKEEEEILLEVYTTMPSNVFKGTNTKIETATRCVSELAEAWEEYTAARIVYADALLNHNWAHRGNKVREDLITNATDTIREAYEDYFEKMDIFKRAHGAYKTAVRELLRGHLL